MCNINDVPNLLGLDLPPVFVGIEMADDSTLGYWIVIYEEVNNATMNDQGVWFTNIDHNDTEFFSYRCAEKYAKALASCEGIPFVDLPTVNKGLTVEKVYN